MPLKPLRRSSKTIISKAMQAGAGAIAKTKPTARIQLLVGLKAPTAAKVVKRLKMRRLQDRRGWQIYHGGMPSRAACRPVAAALKREGIFAMCTGRSVRGVHKAPKKRKKAPSGWIQGRFTTGRTARIQGRFTTGPAARRRAK